MPAHDGGELIVEGHWGFVPKKNHAHKPKINQPTCSTGQWTVDAQAKTLDEGCMILLWVFWVGYKTCKPSILMDAQLPYEEQKFK